MISRRGVITGLVSFAAAPAIVRVSSLMKLPPPVRGGITEHWNGIVRFLAVANVPPLAINGEELFYAVMTANGFTEAGTARFLNGAEPLARVGVDRKTCA